MPKKLDFHSSEPYEVPTPKAVYNFKVYLIALMGTAAALDYGYDLGFIGTTQSLEPYKEMMGTAHNAAYRTSFNSNVVAIFQAGAIVGSMMPALFANRFGKKPINIFMATLFILGSVIQSIAGVGGSNPNACMLAGRFLNGLSVGGSNTVAPYIVSEMSPPSIRGRLVGMYEIGVQLGTLLGFWVCYGLTRHHAVNNMLWRIPFLLQLIFGGLYLLGAILVPESPRHFAKYGRERVATALGRIRNLSVSDAWLNCEVDDICEQYEQEQTRPGWKGFISELKTKSIRNRFIMITILFIFFQFSGTNSVNYYSPTIFAKLGLKGDEIKFLATGIYGVIRFAAILVAMGYAVDKFGRKINLMVFGGLMALCMWIIGGLVKAKAGGVAGPLTLIYIYAAAFCFSFAGIPYIINVEIWPARIRPYGVSWGVFVHWVFNLVIGKSTPYMVESLDYGFFWLYAGFLTASVVFVAFFVPETKGVPLERVEVLFGGSVAAVGPLQPSGREFTASPDGSSTDKQDISHLEK